jgi:hypothetical protein
VDKGNTLSQQDEMESQPRIGQPVPQGDSGIDDIKIVKNCCIVMALHIINSLLGRYEVSLAF